MAFFGFKKKDATQPTAPAQGSKPAVKKEVEKAKVVSAGSMTGTTHTLAHVLRNPRITEKATMHAEASAYIFDVAPSATKRDIASAVFAAYKVSPRMVRVVTVPSKNKRSMKTGKRGVKQGGKKAYVYLKKGETIAIT